MDILNSLMPRVSTSELGGGIYMVVDSQRRQGEVGAGSGSCERVGVRVEAYRSVQAVSERRVEALGRGLPSGAAGHGSTSWDGAGDARGRGEVGAGSGSHERVGVRVESWRAMRANSVGGACGGPARILCC